MKNVNVTLRVDEDLKKQADALFSELGLNLTTAYSGRIWTLIPVRTGQ